MKYDIPVRQLIHAFLKGEVGLIWKKKYVPLHQVHYSVYFWTSWAETRALNEKMWKEALL